MTGYTTGIGQKFNRGSNFCVNNVQYCRAHSRTLRNDVRHDVTMKKVMIRRFTLLYYL